MSDSVTDPISIIVTKELVAQWRDEADELERRANRLRRKATAGEQILQATDADEADRGNWPASAPPDEQPETVPKSFVGAIKFFANRSRTSMSRDELRAALIGAGFPASTVNGQYLSVAISNLKKATEISVDATGAVGRAPSK
jgi:hypothetical protein